MTIADILQGGDASTSSPTRTNMRTLSIRQTAAVVAGMALEYYDFTVFAFFAPQIGRAFFPQVNESNNLLFVLATFGAGFLVRPLGAIVVGRWGDSIGRKPALILSFTLAGLAITGIAVTPPYLTIGIAAPLLLVFFRLLQGFAMGGEAGPSVSLLVEASPPKRRGFYVSFHPAAASLATLVAGLIGLGLASVIDAEHLALWGWRIAFLIGAATVPLGLILRRGLPETKIERDPVPWKQVPNMPRVALLGIAIYAGNVTAFYVLSYISTFANHTLHMPAPVAYGATIVSGLCGTLCCPLIGGPLSDIWGRKRVITSGYGILALVAVPCFALMATFRTPIVLYGVTAVMAIAQAVGAASILAALAENLPAGVRSGGVGTIFGLAVAVFGGSAQFVVAWLTTTTGSPLAPALYMALMLSAGLTAIMALKETAPAQTSPVMTQSAR